MFITIVLLRTVIFLLLCKSCLGKTHSFQAAVVRGNHLIHFRANSSVKKVVYLKDDDSITFFFCLRKQTSVTVSSLRYSNGNRPDVCLVLLNDIEVGYVVTNTSMTKVDAWNVFFSSEKVGSTVLENGWHSLKILVRGSDGVEIDEVTVDIEDVNLTPDMLQCKIHCLNSVPFRKSKPEMNVFREAILTQRSYPTKCAEEDNVKVPIYLDEVEEYRLTATLPMYKTFSNRREENTSYCSFLSPLYWKFSDVNVTYQRDIKHSKSAILKTFKHNTKGSLSTYRIKISFTLKGRSKGHVDADIGSILTLTIKPLGTTSVFLGSFKGREKSLSHLDGGALIPGKRQYSWNIPDFTWSEVNENIITISINTLAVVPLYIEEIKLERRPMRPNRVIPIFKSDSIIIEGIDIDFWWRSPESMMVWIENNSSVFYNVDFFRISFPVPWADGFAEVFVLYQDGNVRLLPLPPSGIDWIPFGTSVIVGTSDPDLIRPSAPIDRVDINTIKREIKIHYANGEKAKMTLMSKLDKTELVISDLVFHVSNRNRFPFATLRSMYIEDGNTDCDSITVDDSAIFSVMDKWNYKQGKSFTFFRRCESKHLTLSPDIRLDLTRTRQPFPFILNQWWHDMEYQNNI